MSEVVDMNTARAQKVVREAEEEHELIACIGCQGVQFHLLPEGEVVCSGCHHLIVPLRWYDVNQPART